MHYHDLVPNRDLIDYNPICTFLTPFHPITLGWQIGAQTLLWDTLRERKQCPHAAILSSYNTPNYWSLGKEWMISIKTSLDYWRCYAYRPRMILESQEYRSLFSKLGVSFDSASLGLKSNQVQSAINQVQKIYPVNSHYSIKIVGNGGNTEVNEGLTKWIKDNCSNLVEDSLQKLGVVYPLLQ